MKLKTLFTTLLISFSIIVNAQNWDVKGDIFYGETADDELGSSVSLNQDASVLAIGQTNWKQSGFPYGRVQIFKLVSNQWQQMGQDLIGTTTNSDFGNSVELNAEGNVVIITAPNTFVQGVGSQAGEVRIYKYNQTTDTWEQKGQTLEGLNYDDRFGYSAAIDSVGDRIIISAPFYNFDADNLGYVIVYEYNSTTDKWLNRGTILRGMYENHRLGMDVDINSDGNRIAIGSRYYTEGADTYIGQAQVYDYNGTDSYWEEVGDALNGPEAYSYFGEAISLSGDGSKIAISAPYYNSTYGTVEVYKLTEGAWELDGTEIMGVYHDYLGTDVKLNYDGNTLAISSSLYDDQTGFVNIYNRAETDWEQTIDTIYGTINLSQFGNSISLSDDGIGIAIGAHYYNYNGTHDGSVTVYGCICNSNPIADAVSLSELSSECSIALNNYIPTATSACGAKIYGTTETMNFSQIGTNTITWTFNDGFGNSITQQQTVNIIDTTPPIPPTLSEISEQCSVEITEIPTATDNCEGTITATTNDPLEYYSQGTYTITWTFNDSNGNSSEAEQTIKVDDYTKPEITCVSDQVFTASSNNYYTVQGTELDPTSTSDNCNISSISNDFNNTATLEGEELPVGTNTIEWTITDDAGNTETCTFNITVNSLTNIESISKDIKIYPNPTNKFVNITTKNLKILEISITDLTGKTIKNIQTNNFCSQIDLSDLDSGIYIIKIKSDKNTFYNKIIKK